MFKLEFHLWNLARTQTVVHLSQEGWRGGQFCFDAETTYLSASLRLIYADGNGREGLRIL